MGGTLAQHCPGLDLQAPGQCCPRHKTPCKKSSPCPSNRGLKRARSWLPSQCGILIKVCSLLRPPKAGLLSEGARHPAGPTYLLCLPSKGSLRTKVPSSSSARTFPCWVGPQILLPGYSLEPTQAGAVPAFGGSRGLPAVGNGILTL